ncbi:gustatory receptor 48 [Nasonia vitripennis]|uniref:Gustatory receptor n=1 Tax=Nasonia vitripennis TaxID=7425 RepID=A0A7M6UPI1_NASVI|nr:gustatory receptor 48 [Nasonia vitripennis]
MRRTKPDADALPSVENVTRTLTPVLWLSRFSGLTVFEMPAGTPWPKFSAAYALFLCSAYGTMIWFGETFIVKETTSVPLVIFIYALVKYVNAFLAAVSFAVGLLHYKKTMKFTKRLKHVDETLKVFGIEPEYAASRKENIRIVLIWIVATVFQIIGDAAICFVIYDPAYIAILKFFIFHIPFQSMSLLELTFAMKISTVRSRFEKLNALFQNVLENPVLPMHFKHVNKYHNILRRQHSEEGDRNRKNLELLLMTSRQLHLELCAITREINEVYGKQLAMSIAAKFIYVTGYGYVFYLYYNEPSISLSIKILNCTYIAYNLTFITVMMIYFIGQSVAAQKTTQIAHEMPVTQSQTKIIDEIHQFSLQVTQHPLEITAASLFTLNFAFMRGFIGSMTTYLIILIQYQPNIAAAAKSMIDEIMANMQNVSAFYHFANFSTD